VQFEAWGLATYPWGSFGAPAGSEMTPSVQFGSLVLRSPLGFLSLISCLLSRARCSLALEAKALLGGLGLAGVGFHPIDPDIRGRIWTDVSSTAHLKLTTAPPAFMEVAAGLPDFKPLPEIERPFDPPLLRCLTLLEIALEQGA